LKRIDEQILETKNGFLLTLSSLRNLCLVSITFPNDNLPSRPRPQESPKPTHSPEPAQTICVTRTCICIGDPPRAAPGIGSARPITHSKMLPSRLACMHTCAPYPCILNLHFDSGEERKHRVALVQLNYFVPLPSEGTHAAQLITGYITRPIEAGITALSSSPTVQPYYEHLPLEPPPHLKSIQ